MFEHTLYTLTSDFSTPRLAVTISSRVSTQPLSTVSPAPLHPFTQILTTLFFGETPWVHTSGSRLTGRHVQPSGKENIAADTKMVNFFLEGGSR